MTALPYLVAGLLTGCVVVPANSPPRIDFAEVSCFEDQYGVWLWTFDAEVRDADGNLSVNFVDAFVYDAFSGVEVDAFALDPLSDSRLWGLTVFERDTNLFCGDAYDIDFIAEDNAGDIDIFGVTIN